MESSLILGSSSIIDTGLASFTPVKVIYQVTLECFDSSLVPTV